MDTDFEAKLLASYQRSERFTETHICPRGPECGRKGDAVWQNDDTCSFCGSLNPDLLMERIEAGTVILVPSDKNYKVYVRPESGSPAFRQTFRGEGDPGGGDPTKWVWTTREVTETKFYFQHLSTPARRRFVELLNQKKLKLDYPGYFYRLPFFIGPPGPPNPTRPERPTEVG